MRAGRRGGGPRDRLRRGASLLPDNDELLACVYVERARVPRVCGRAAWGRRLMTCDAGLSLRHAGAHRGTGRTLHLGSPFLLALAEPAS